MNEDDEIWIYFNGYNHVDITDFCYYFPEEGYFACFEIYIFTILRLMRSKYGLFLVKLSP